MTVRQALAWAAVAMIPLAGGLWASPPAFAYDRLSLWDDAVRFGGEIRGRGEFYENFYSPDGLSERDDDFFLLRSRFYVDIQPQEHWRIFLQGQDSRQWGSEYLDRGVIPNPAENDIDLFQGYIEAIRMFDTPFSLRAGRQTLLYGDQRLVGPLNWTNTARTFDAVKLMAEVEGHGKIDLFASQPVAPEWGRFDRSDDHNQLYGVYTSWSSIPYLDALDAYYLLRNAHRLDDEVHTLGARAARRYENGWDWSIELAGQFGEFRGRDHLAWAASGEVGYTFETAWRPRAGLGYRYASGDEDPSNDKNNTFDNLFPTNHMHYGQMDLFAWRNMRNAELNLRATPFERMTAEAAVHVFWLAEPNSDHWYNAAGRPVRFAQAGAASYVGTELDLKLNYRFCEFFSIEGGYSRFFAGEFIKNTGDAKDANWGYVMTTMTF